MRNLFAFVLFCLCLGSIVVALPANVSIKEWDVPTAKSRPHDPALAPDGSLWYTGQMANKLGRLDPQTGQIKEFPLKTPESGPHGLVADREGNIWFTAIFKHYIGKLNPKTGEIVEYPMPDPKADPIRRSLTARGSSGSPRSRRTSSAGSIRAPARSNSKKCRRRMPCLTASW